jgi:hypothetical protein
MDGHNAQAKRSRRLRRRTWNVILDDQRSRAQPA